MQASCEGRHENGHTWWKRRHAVWMRMPACRGFIRSLYMRGCACAHRGELKRWPDRQSNAGRTPKANVARQTRARSIRTVATESRTDLEIRGKTEMGKPSKMAGSFHVVCPTPTPDPAHAAPPPTQAASVKHAGTRAASVLHVGTRASWGGGRRTHGEPHVGTRAASVPHVGTRAASVPHVGTRAASVPHVGTRATVSPPGSRAGRCGRTGGKHNQAG